MKDKIKNIINTKKFNIYMLILIIVIILLVVILISFKYSVEGEVNLPFYLSKIAIISNVEGIDNNEDTENKWNMKVNQNNDIYLYIKKNENYTDTEIIDNIKLENFNIQRKNNEIGEVKLLKPESKIQNVIFRNITENEVDSIQYKGDLESSIKDLKISNQGGLVVFRYAINNVGNYISNDEEINHNELLKNININNEDLNFKILFDICINLTSGKSFKATVNLELPIDDVVNNGVQSKEFTDLEDIVFKRL